MKRDKYIKIDIGGNYQLCVKESALPEDVAEADLRDLVADAMSSNLGLTWLPILLGDKRRYGTRL